jgi:predicted choloylglycine hydrolase
MNEITLRGTHYEMGRQVGQQLRASGVDLPKLSGEQARYTELLVRTVEGRIPDLVQEMHGIAEGGGYEERSVQFHSLAIGIVPSCTVIAVSGAQTATGRALFGRNYDSHPESSSFTLYRTYPVNGLAHIGCCYDMLVGREDGLNEAGLAIAVAGVQGHYTSRPGVWDHIPVRAVLEQCRTVDEAVPVIKSLPHVWTKNFLVADAGGAIAAVEAGQEGVATVRLGRGFGAIANHFVTQEMRAYCDEEKIPANSIQRLETARRWFEARPQQAGGVKQGELKQLLSSTDHGVRSELGPKFTTVWSWVAELGERRIELCDRLPEPDAYREQAF